MIRRDELEFPNWEGDPEESRRLVRQGERLDPLKSEPEIGPAAAPSQSTRQELTLDENDVRLAERRPYVRTSPAALYPEAIRLVRKGGRSPAEAAAVVGFSDQTVRNLVSPRPVCDYLEKPQYAIELQ